MNDQRLFDHTLQHSPIGMSLVSLEGQILKVNDVLCNLIGYTEEELFLSNPLIYTHDEDSHLDNYYFNKFQNGEIEECEFCKRLTHKQGHIVSLKVKVSLVRDENGQPLVFVSQLQDITDILKSKQTMQHTEAKLIHILESITDGFVAFNQKHQYTYVNKTAEVFLEKKRVELLGRVVWEVFPEVGGTIFHEKYMECVKTNYPIHFESPFFDKGNWLEVRMYPSTEGVTLFFNDISERKMVEKELKESEERYRSVVESSTDAIIVNRDGKLVFANKAAIKMLGASNESEIIGLHKSTFFSNEIAPLMLEREKHLYANTPVQNPIFAKLKRLDHSEVEIETSCVLISYNGKKAIQCIARDVTERNKLDQIVRKSEKLSIVGELAAGVAHEVRNPLTAIKGFLQFSRNLKQYNEEYTTIMLQELERVENIIYEFLTLAKPTSVSKFVQSDLVLLVKQVITLQETQALLLGIEIKSHLEDVPLVDCQPNQIKQVLVNIIQNALEAMPGKGTVTVMLSNLDEQKIEVKIIDEGYGIPKDRLARLGEPFYSSKEKGTGLGLMVSYKIIENHQGFLTFHSAEGKGTEVKIIIPTKQNKN